MEQQTDIDIIWPAARFCEQTYVARLQETQDSFSTYSNPWRFSRSYCMWNIVL